MPSTTQTYSMNSKAHALIHMQYSQIINARAEAIYDVISDYRVGHPAVLPKPYFTSLTVEQGGKGAGTILRMTMRVFGKDFAYHQIVSEPQPGRVIVEAETDGSLVTSFTLEPLNNGTQTRVTIATDFTPKPGFAGFMERWMNPPVMRHIYKQELQNIAEYVSNN